MGFLRSHNSFSNKRSASFVTIAVEFPAAFCSELSALPLHSAYASHYVEEKSGTPTVKKEVTGVEPSSSHVWGSVQTRKFVSHRFAGMSPSAKNVFGGVLNKIYQVDLGLINGQQFIGGGC